MPLHDTHKLQSTYASQLRNSKDQLPSQYFNNITRST